MSFGYSFLLIERLGEVGPAMNEWVEPCLED